MRYSAEKILAKRKEKDLTQAEVSSRSKLSIPTISSIENGHKKYITPDTLEALADALRCEPAELTI
jgi:transcriptional regulator with XRE-family HTH domain